MRTIISQQTLKPVRAQSPVNAQIQSEVAGHILAPPVAHVACINQNPLALHTSDVQQMHRSPRQPQDSLTVRVLVSTAHLLRYQHAQTSTA